MLGDKNMSKYEYYVEMAEKDILSGQYSSGKLWTLLAIAEAIKDYA